MKYCTLLLTSLLMLIASSLSPPLAEASESTEVLNDDDTDGVTFIIDQMNENRAVATAADANQLAGLKAMPAITENHEVLRESLKLKQWRGYSGVGFLLDTKSSTVLHSAVVGSKILLRDAYPPHPKNVGG